MSVIHAFPPAAQLPYSLVSFRMALTRQDRKGHQDHKDHKGHQDRKGHKGHKGRKGRKDQEHQIQMEDQVQLCHLGLPVDN